MKTLAILAVLGIALAGCTSVATTHDAVKLNFVGVNINEKTGVSGGQGSITVDRVPQIIPAGSVLNTVNACGQTDAQDTYANLNSKASASATTVPGSAAGAAGIASPSIAIATGDVTANGCAAIVAAAATTAHPADVVSAALNHSTLPSAPAGSIVRDGVAPPDPAATK